MRSQFELPKAEEVFNLACECGQDPDRVIKERLDAAIAAAAAKEYEMKMQRTFSECPGFLGGDLPSGEGRKGNVIIDPAKALEARTWLKRRFICNDSLELSALGLCIELMPRSRAKSAPGRRHHVATFAKPVQYELSL